MARDYCWDLLGTEELYRYQELYDDHNNNESRQSEWVNLVMKLNSNDEDIGSSVYEGRYNFEDDFEENLEVKRKRLLAYHQLEVFSLYLKDKPAESAAYCKLLVSIFSFVHAYIIVMTIISHHHSVGALQSQGNREIGAWAAIGVYGFGGIRVGSGGGKCGSCRC